MIKSYNDYEPSIGQNVYISENASLIKSKHNKYSLTEGISDRLYSKIINR